MATIRDIASKLGISQGTVSKGLNGATDISETLRNQILATAAELGYTKRGIGKTENRKLCIFIENMDYYMEDDFGYEIIRGFRQAAYKEQWAVEVVPVSHHTQERYPYDQLMIREGFSGALILGFSYDDPWMEALKKTKLPTVLFDHYVSGNPTVGFVGSDSEEGIDLAIAHLAGLGHKKIAFLSGEETSMISEFRLHAYRKSMKARGLTPAPELYAVSNYSTGADSAMVLSLISAGATAILCGSDLIAYSVIRCCDSEGISIPEDLSLIGYDDLPTSSTTRPPLTTVRQDRSMIGQSGYFALHALIQGVSLSRNLLRPTWEIRKATGKAI